MDIIYNLYTCFDCYIITCGAWSFARLGSENFSWLDFAANVSIIDGFWLKIKKRKKGTLVWYLLD